MTAARLLGWNFFLFLQRCRHSILDDLRDEMVRHVIIFEVLSHGGLIVAVMLPEVLSNGLLAQILQAGRRSLHSTTSSPFGWLEDVLSGFWIEKDRWTGRIGWRFDFTFTLHQSAACSNIHGKAHGHADDSRKQSHSFAWEFPTEVYKIGGIATFTVENDSIKRFQSNLEMKTPREVSKGIYIYFFPKYFMRRLIV